MNFHQRNKSFLTNESLNKKVYVSVATVVVLFAFFLLPWTRNLLFNIGSSVWGLENNMVSFFYQNSEILKSKESLINENILLKKQITLRERNDQLFDLLKNENNDLKSILGRKNSDQKFLLAAVLTKPIFSPFDTLIIDVGLVDGVTVGDKIIVDGDVFIGYISEVYDHESKVVLYSSPGEKVKVLIGSNNIEKEATGLGGGNFIVEMPRESDINEGDIITMPDISTNLFGVVEKIEFKDSDSLQDVLFKNPVNVTELKWVEVVLSNKK